MYTDTDKTWAEFISSCMNMPDNCALAKHATTAAELGEKLDRLMDDVKFHPIPAGNAIIDYSTVKNLILGRLYRPSQYPQLADELVAVLNKNTTALAALGSGSAGDALQVDVIQASLGIKCGDKFRRTEDISEVRSELEGQLYKTSARFGDAPTMSTTACPQWRFQAKERYEGDFRVKTSHPVLLIGNTFDPVTPLKTAYSMSKGFEGSVVLEQHSHGVSRSFSVTAYSVRTAEPTMLTCASI
jgi:hypothetical protein